jgi:glutamate-5-semialdehyde dehydrogenase
MRSLRNKGAELDPESLVMAKMAKEAKKSLRRAGSAVKDKALEKIANALVKNSRLLIAANKKDLEAGRKKGLSSALLDRLTLNPQRISAMADSVREVKKLSDPVGEITRAWTRPNGLVIARMRIPLGVILIIYEARPNVTVEAASLCLKSGNAVILRGGSEAINSNLALGNIIGKSIAEAGIDPAAVQVVPGTEHKTVDELLKLDEYIDLVIPRGGEELIRKVVKMSHIPTLKHYKGVCHIFVDKDADLEKAYKVCFNAKVQRPGVCNAMETLLVDKAVAKKFLPKMAGQYKAAGVELRADERARKIICWAGPATEADWRAEYLDLILSVAVVDGLDQAVEHIQAYGSDHTEAIITENYGRAMEFIRRVDSSSVMVNASTRFSDGFQYGLGAEIGISTTRLHAYGPMALEELTVTKFVVFGNGQIRES